jgi:branched-chain amino acid transport system substrate-binding protein
MFGNLRRGLTLILFTMVLAACRVVPDTGGPSTGPAPVATPTPSATGLPQDEGRHRVALLVPLSGANAEVGQAIANATTMALLDTNADNLRITTYDTAAGASSAATRAVADGNKLILGPLVRDDVGPIIAEARPANVPLIAFSNDAGIARPDVFVMGNIPEQSIERTVAFAVGKGARRFAALVPEGEYGERAITALRAAAARHNATVVTSETYNRGNTSIVSAATRLDTRGGFDTVLIADGARLAAMAAGQLKNAGESLPSLIGPELWAGDASLTTNSAMRGAWYSTVSDARYRQFATSYEARFGSAPPRIASLGYDAVLLALRVARDWQPGQQFPTGRMLDPGGFLGVDGAFRFGSTGLGERAFEVREVGNGSVTIVDAAPREFGS